MGTSTVAKSSNFLSIRAKASVWSAGKGDCKPIDNQRVADEVLAKEDLNKFNNKQMKKIQNASHDGGNGRWAFSLIATALLPIPRQSRT
jgi:hypothetical protein